MSEVKSVDLVSLLSSEGRDFLVRNNDDQVNVKDLCGKTVGLYFSASWCPPCRNFTPVLTEVYQERSSARGDFEIVFVSSDRDEESYKGYFAKMPWLAIPFSDPADPAVKRLKEEFEVRGIPCLVLIDGAGNVTSTQGVKLVREYGAEAYPFTTERIKQLKEEEELARQNQTLKSILVSASRDYVISNDDKKVPVSEIEGKTVGLYFTVTTYPPCVEFTEKLVEIYNKLKEKGENFEVVMIYLDDSKEEFKEGFAKMPWLSLPFDDKACEKLARYFELRTIPRLVIIGPDGKTLNTDVSELIDEHGIEAYPFTPEKLAELAEIEEARLQSQTLESLLVSGDKDFVLDKNGSKVPVSDLVGKHVLIYFSAHWCPPCRGFTPKLVEVYNEIKAKESAFEVIFVSSDRDQASFDEYYSSMPWLTLPFGDERKASLSRTFKVQGIPTLVAIGPSGRTVTNDARGLVMKHGADAFPFADDHIERLEKKAEEGPKEGYICDGDVCRKA